MIGKNLKSLDRVDQGRTFLKRALDVAENLLPLSNTKLVNSIKADIEDFETDIRSLPAKRKIEDADTLLNKMVNMIADKKKIPASSLSSRSQRPPTDEGSKREKSLSSERKDLSVSSKPPLATKRSLPISKTPSRTQKATKAKDDSVQLNMSIKENPAKKRNLPKRPKRIPPSQNFTGK